MQVFSVKVLRGPEPESTRTLIFFKYPIPDQYLIFIPVPPLISHLMGSNNNLIIKQIQNRPSKKPANEQKGRDYNANQVDRNEWIAL